MEAREEGHGKGAATQSNRCLTAAIPPIGGHIQHRGEPGQDARNDEQNPSDPCSSAGTLLLPHPHFALLSAPSGPSRAEKAPLQAEDRQDASGRGRTHHWRGRREQPDSG